MIKKADLRMAREELKQKPAMRKLCQRIIDLFFVEKYYALQYPNGYYPHYNTQHPKEINHAYHITPEKIWLHLHGYISIGTYFVSQMDMCKIICIDVDNPHINNDKSDQQVTREQGLKDIHPKTRKIYQNAVDLNLHPILEYSGNKGYHIWIFFEDEVPAEQAYLVARLLINNVDRKIEANPKQKGLGNRKVGNLVKLPICSHQKSKKRSRIVNFEFEPIAQQYNAIMNITMTPIGAFRKAYKIAQNLIGKYHQKDTSDIVFDPTLNPFDVSIDGPGERDDKQYYFIRQCIRKGIDHKEALQMGVKWLKKYQHIYDAEEDEAITHFKRRLVHAWHTQLNQDIHVDNIEISFADVGEV